MDKFIITYVDFFAVLYYKLTKNY